MRDKCRTESLTSEPESYLVPATEIAQSLPLDKLFPRRAPLHVDVGCGKGRFLLARSQRFPDIDFLGIDRLLVRLRKIEKKLIRQDVTNVRLVHMEASYTLGHMMPPGSVHTFYIFFPDPWPKRRHHRRRLINPSFLDALSHVLEPGGTIHFATDHLEYFRPAAACFRADARFSDVPAFSPTEEERTDFERLFTGQGKEIGRASFRLNEAPTSRPA